MGDFLFVVKCLAMTLLLLVVMQIRIEHRTLEQHAVRWIHRSSAVEELRLVAESAVRSGREGYARASDYFGDKETEITEDGSWFKVKRSEAYQRQKAKEEREARRNSSDASLED